MREIACDWDKLEIGVKPRMLSTCRYEKNSDNTLMSVSICTRLDPNDHLYNIT
jgi:hypothetical protein